LFSMIGLFDDPVINRSAQSGINIAYPEHVVKFLVLYKK